MSQKPLLSFYNSSYYYNGKKYFYKKDAEKVRNRLRGSYYRTKLRVKLISILGSKCSKCPITDIRCLQIDHINGNGTVKRKSLGYHNELRYYINNPEIAKKELQVLCANHNWIKRSEDLQNWKIGE